jgi:DNA-binding GntR family transcriptional regulator
VALNRANLRQQAISLLRTRILGGELEPDTVYSATMLGTDLGVSPTPIREAMLDLANDGLVEVVPNKGYRLTNPTEKDLNEISELRLMLEVPALDAVIARAEDRDLARLDKPVKRCIAAAKRGDLTAFLLSDREFHLGLIENAGNERLTRLVATLRDQTRLLGLKHLADSGQLDESALEHARILDAVKDRDAKLAEKLMRNHLAHTRGLWAGQSEDDAGDAAEHASTVG